MSYGINTPCYRCTKKETCTDQKKLEKAIQEIHASTYEEGHQGGGTIIMQCMRMRNNEPGDK